MNANTEINHGSVVLILTQVRDRRKVASASRLFYTATVLAVSGADWLLTAQAMKPNALQSST